MYPGQWLIIRDKKILSRGKDAAKLLEDFWKKYPGQTPFILKVNTKLSIKSAA